MTGNKVGGKHNFRMLMIHVLFSKMSFTNEHHFYDRSGRNAIEKSMTSTSLLPPSPSRVVCSFAPGTVRACEDGG